LTTRDGTLIESPAGGTYLRSDRAMQLDTDEESAVAVEPGLYQGLPERPTTHSNTCTLGLMVEPRERGELGYGEWCIRLFEMGLCSCDGCGGHLVGEGTCSSCGCRHGIHQPSRFHRQQFPAWVPVTRSGRCSHADAVRADEKRERDRQARKRWAAEDLGDPRR
jgi:hypothetical protein